MTDESLEQQLCTLESLLDAADSALLACSPSGMVTVCNAAARRLMGTFGNVMVGDTFERVLVASQIVMHRSAFARALEGESSLDVNGSISNDGGAPTSVRFAYFPIRARDGLVVGVAIRAMELESPQRPSPELHDTRQLLQLILDNIPQGAFWKDRNLTYLGCNQRAARDAGLAVPEDIVGKTDHDLAWSKLADAYRADDREVLKCGSPKLNYEEEILRRDGMVTYVATCKIPLRDPSGEIIGLLGTYEDITERRVSTEALRLSEERFALAMRGANDGLWDCDLLTNRASFSRRLKSMVGMDTGETEHVMEELHQLIHPDDVARVDEAMYRYLSGESERFEVEYRLRHSSGQYLFVLARGFAVRQSGVVAPTRFVGTLVDISELKAAEASLQAAIVDLKRSNQELEQFAYVASHDLQEPLRMVASFTQLLAERYRGRLDEKADKYIAYAVDGARRMQGLINDLLALSRVGTREVRFEMVDCNALVRVVLDHLAPTIQELNAQVVVGELPTLKADPSQLSQLFQNLVGNALKFHRELAPHVELCARLHGVHWIFEVSDNGIGIELAYLERIFVIFQRLHERGQYPGSGIGLAIARKIVDRHGGRIWAESEPGRGSCFKFTLPVTYC